MKPLPASRPDAFKRVRVRVGPSSTIRVLHNTFSVPSQLIGERVDVHVLAETLEVWYAQRRISTIPRLRGESKIPLDKTLESFDLKRLPLKLQRRVRVLIDGSFLDRHENVLVFGKPGSGKSHLLFALGQELIQRGRRVLATTCSLLVQQLLIAKRDIKLARVLKVSVRRSQV